MTKGDGLSNVWLQQGPRPSKGRYGCMNEKCVHRVVESTKNTLGLAVLG